jgi:hypothetical protein
MAKVAVRDRAPVMAALPMVRDGVRVWARVRAKAQAPMPRGVMAGAEAIRRVVTMAASVEARAKVAGVNPILRPI